MGLEEQLAENIKATAHLAGQLEVILPKLDKCVPRGECDLRHKAVEKKLDEHHAALKAEIKNGHGGALTPKLVAIAALLFGTLSTAVTALAKIAIHALGIGQ